ncbi:hypothetical protein WMY93_010209 [Mugilogobius chulae]|uniref:GAGE domain-containing protein n=1 Tax=Mugilogobius chulae TaxID=88201 RepID=A0AAW0P7Z4_9GOBI
MRDTVKADVTQGDSPEALEAQSQPAISLIPNPIEQSCKPPGIIENTKPDVTQGDDGTPREQKCIVPQEETTQSVTEQESVVENTTAENTEPVKVTSSDESPAGLTHENPATPAQDAPSQVDLLGLLPPDVLPMLAAMG